MTQRGKSMNILFVCTGNTCRSPMAEHIFRQKTKYFKEEISTRRIKTNKIKCRKCGDIIESTYTHDLKYCECGAVAVDGGHDYLRRVGNPEDWEDFSDYTDDDE